MNPNNLVFTAATGGNPNPPTQQVNVNGTGNYIISTNAPWLGASTGAFNGTGGTAPDILTVEVQSTSLASGSYTGTITLQPTSGQFTTISVSLTVNGSGTTNSTISAAPSQLSFGFELGTVLPVSQTTQITSSGIALPFSFSINQGNTGPTTCPVGWLQATVSSNSTPAVLTVSIANPGGALAQGTCSGNIGITSNTAGNGTTTTLVGVVLFVSAANSPLLNVTVPNALSSVTLQQGVAPVQFNITLASSDNNSLGFTAQVTAGLGWLAISPAGGTVPGGGGTTSINVQITPGTILSPQTYLGSIQINSSGLLGGSLKIPVTMILTSKNSVTISPSGPIAFNQLQGGSLPLAQTVTLSGAVSSSFLTVVTAQQSVPAWLLVTPSNGSLTPSAPATLNFAIAQNTLLQGVYSTLVTVSFSNSSIPPATILVSLTVAPPTPALVSTPATLSFSYQSGTAQSPPSQSVVISNPAAGSLNFTVASISDTWLNVSPNTGAVATPGTLTVSVNPQNLPPGSYSGSFTLASTGIASTIIPVTVFVSASTTPQPFIIANNSSGVGSQLAPGEIIYIKGSALGPGNGVSGPYGTALAGVQVTFNGVPGTLLYVSSTQIDVVVPYAVAGSASTSMVVTYQGAQSAPMSQAVAAVALGLSTNNQAGNGQAAALNQDYSFNTPASPAKQGSYISVYGTGGGQTNPQSFDGEVSPTGSLLPLAAWPNVTATIGGKAAPVLFAGAAPGEITGVVQFNIQVPTGVTGGALPIVVFVNGVPSQNGPTVAVQ